MILLLATSSFVKYRMSRSLVKKYICDWPFESRKSDGVVIKVIWISMRYLFQTFLLCLLIITESRAHLDHYHYNMYYRFSIIFGT